MLGTFIVSCGLQLVMCLYMAFVIEWNANVISLYDKSTATVLVAIFAVSDQSSVLEYGMTNGSNLRVAFTTDSTPKRGKKGQQKKVTCVKRVKAKPGVTSHLISVSRVRNN